jgi:hypothetical protein
MLDPDGNKILFQSSIYNREFRQNHMEKLAQELLKRRWAGPTCMPGQTVNGETVIISQTERLQSGQHRLGAAYYAVLLWRKNPDKWKEFWPTEPVLDTLLVVGTSNAPEVVRTLDNTLTRTESDVFYTSDIFQGLPPKDRRLYSRMAAKATDLLWARVGFGTEASPYGRVFKTHTEEQEFYRRHEYLGKCVEHIFQENKTRKLSLLGLSPGECAALMYLMAASAADGDKYRNGSPPSEKLADLDRKAKARDFFKHLAGGNLKAVENALKALTSPQLQGGEALGMGGRAIEKRAVLCLAWNAYLDQKGEVRKADLDLSEHYHQNDDGTILFIDPPNVGGIDLGDKAQEPDEDVSEEEVEIRKAQEQKMKVLREKLPGEAVGPKVQYDKDGKPPPPKLLKKPMFLKGGEKSDAKVRGQGKQGPLTKVSPKPSKQAQTARARKADEDLDAEDADEV